MVDNPIYSRKEDKMSHHHHHRHRRSPQPGHTMSSNGSTKYFLDDNPSKHLPTVVPPETRLYPQINPSLGASRYEPNFMLGYGSLQYPRQLQETPRRTENKESRHMKRPKLYDKTVLDPRLYLQPPTPELPRTFTYGSVGGGSAGGGGRRWHEWHIPRASLWCYHNGSYGGALCTECNWKNQERGIDVEEPTDRINKGVKGGDGRGGGGGGDEAVSICSSINPPPTFTALDNYRPIRPRRPRCNCGTIFAITTVFSLLVLVLIAGFIIYVEVFLKHQPPSTMDRM